VKDLPDVLLRGFSTMLDEKAVSSGNITRDVLKQTIKELLAEAGIGGPVTASFPPPSVSSDNSNTRVHFWNNKFHFLPISFEFPSTDPLTAWKLWWLGNVALGYPPFRRVTSRDLSSRQKANTLSEWSMLMKRITAEIEAATGSPVSTVQTEEEADKLFKIGMSRLELLPTFRVRRYSQLKVTTVVRLMREANKANDPSSQSMPFRSRKRRKVVTATIDLCSTSQVYCSPSECTTPSNTSANPSATSCNRSAEMPSNRSAHSGAITSSNGSAEMPSNRSAEMPSNRSAEMPNSRPQVRDREDQQL